MGFVGMGEEVGRSPVEEGIERLREVQRHGAEEAEERQRQEVGDGLCEGMSALHFCAFMSRGEVWIGGWRCT